MWKKSIFKNMRHNLLACKIIRQSALTLEYSIVDKNKLNCGYEKINFKPSEYLKILASRNIKENYFNVIPIISEHFRTQYITNKLPLLIREDFIFDDKKIKSNNNKIVKICIMVHGLEACSDDLRNMRSLARFHCPDVIFMLSEDNEENTRDSIENMGKKLAKEIHSYLSYYMSDNELEISFIGHSLGGLIIRASLPYLSQYKNCFKTYISIGTPHLGCLTKKFLVSTGLKIMTKFKKYQSLREMSLEDDDGYLVKLSKREGLEWFKYVIFVAAYNDGYVPPASSKVLYSYRKNNNSIFIEMAKNIYEAIQAKRIIKIGIYVPDVDKGLEYYLGRKAHVDILDNHFVKHLIFHQLKEYL